MAAELPRVDDDARRGHLPGLARRARARARRTRRRRAAPPGWPSRPGPPSATRPTSASTSAARGRRWKRPSDASRPSCGRLPGHEQPNQQFRARPPADREAPDQTRQEEPGVPAAAPRRAGRRRRHHRPGPRGLDRRPRVRVGPGRRVGGRNRRLERALPAAAARRGCFPARSRPSSRTAGPGDHLVLMSRQRRSLRAGDRPPTGFRRRRSAAASRWDGGRLDGRLHDPEPARRGEGPLLPATAAPPGPGTVAYGNAASDLPHMVLADRAVMVNPPPACEAAARPRKSTASAGDVGRRNVASGYFLHEISRPVN